MVVVVVSRVVVLLFMLLSLLPAVPLAVLPEVAPDGAFELALLPALVVGFGAVGVFIEPLGA